MKSIYRYLHRTKRIWGVAQPIIILIILITSLVLSFNPAIAEAILTITPLTWNIVGLDSNNVNVGPNNFPVGARVCNSGTDASNVEATFVWDDGLDPYTGHAYINLRPGSLSSITLSSLPGGGTCYDFYYEVSITRNASAYNQTRRYHILVTADGGISLLTPTPRELFVERLISQNRNATDNVRVDGTSIPSGGIISLFVGNTYNIRLEGHTATQGYEQVESFINLPNTIFRINSVTTTYSASPTPHTDLLWNSKLYANGCNWENDPNSPNYRACWSTGKYGGTVSVTFNVTIIGGAGTSQNLNTLIYDFSGSSYHYNADFSVSGRIANIIGPSTISMTKRFVPDTINPGGTSRLMFTLSNPTTVSINGVNFSDSLPTIPDTMQVANTPGVSYSGCGAGAFSPALIGGEGTISFSNGTIAPNSSCIIKVNVSAPSIGTYVNTTDNLFINSTVDTGNSATASLSVANAPSCTPGQLMARWTIPVGTTANPPDTTGGLPTTRAGNVPTAVASLGPGISGSSIDPTGNPANSWRIWGFVRNNQALDPTDYIQFAIDTRHYRQVQMNFDQSISASVGPTDLYVYYSTDGTNFTLKARYGPGSPPTYPAGSTPYPSTTWTNYPHDFTNQTSITGLTYFRILGWGANNQNQGADMFLDNITFSGCSLATPPPTISKSFLASPIPVNSATRLTFTISNSQPGYEPLTNVQFSDPLPDGLQVANPANAGSTGAGCTGVTFNPMPSSTTISYSAANMTAGATCTAYVDVRANRAGQFDNVSGYISATESGQNQTANGYATASLVAVAPPVIAKAFSASPILTGSSTALSFSIANPNQSTTLSGIGFTDNLPAGLVVATPNGLSGTCGGGTITATAGSSSISLSGASLAGGVACTFSVNVVGTTAGTHNNVTTSVTSTEGVAGNVASATLVVKDPTPNINLLKQVSLTASDPWTSFVAVNPPLPQSVYFRFIVENTGDVALVNVSVTDVTFPTLLTNCASELSGGLALYETKTCMSEPVEIGGAGSYTNTAYASGDSVTSPNSTARYATTGLELEKSVTESNFSSVGATLHYSFRVTNSGYAPLIGPVTISDDKTTDESCPAVNTVGDFDNFLEPGEQITCTATYTVQAADMSAMFVTNIASATADNVTSNTDTQTVNRALDFGDLHSGYNSTLLSDDGARHAIGSLFLGISVGPETDGQESPTASADLNDDGIVRTGNWSDSTGNLNVTVSGGRGCLMGWLDYWDGSASYIPNYDFSDPGELIIDNQPVNTGVTPFSFSLPPNSSNYAGWFARFRLVPDQDDDGDCSDQTAVGLIGLAVNGEVEDYYWEFSPTSIDILYFSAHSAHRWPIWVLILAGGVVAGFGLFLIQYKSSWHYEKLRNRVDRS